MKRSIWKTHFRGVSEQAQTELLSKMPNLEGALLTDDLLQETTRAVKSYDSRLEIQIINAPGPNEYLKLPEWVRGKFHPAPNDNSVNLSIYDPATLPQRVKIEPGVQESMLIEKTMPVDPRQTAENAHETVIVQLTVVVGKDGTVKDIEPLASRAAITD